MIAAATHLLNLVLQPHYIIALIRRITNNSSAGVLTGKRGRNSASSEGAPSSAAPPSYCAATPPVRSRQRTVLMSVDKLDLPNEGELVLKILRRIIFCV